jgi:hypothetical protein
VVLSLQSVVRWFCPYRVYGFVPTERSEVVLSLQSVKLLYSEAKKGSTLLHYIVGGRVLDYVRRSLESERALTKMLR